MIDETATEGPPPIADIVVHAYTHVTDEYAPDPKHLAEILAPLDTPAKACEFAYGFARLAAAVTRAAGRTKFSFEFADVDEAHSDDPGVPASWACMQAYSAHINGEKETAFAVLLPLLDRPEVAKALPLATCVVLSQPIDSLSTMSVAAVSLRQLRKGARL